MKGYKHNGKRIHINSRKEDGYEGTSRVVSMMKETRLFCVAITMAKEKLFLITKKGNESSYLQEIPEIYTIKTGCP